MTRIECSTRTGRIAGALILAIGIATAGASLIGASAATAAETVADDAQLKAYWQGRYRDLKRNEARLVQTVELATKEYADANRRTYRRSGVRHFHRTNANEAKAELALVRAELEAIYDEASAAGVPIHWLDEVAEETVDMDAVQGLGVYRDDGEFGGKGAYAKEPDPDEAGTDPADADDGRNPLYTGDDDEPASFDAEGSKEYDYDDWRKDRIDYERKRAPEKHLAPEDLGLDEDS
jgi:hypothetical protein